MDIEKTYYRIDKDWFVECLMIVCARWQTGEKCDKFLCEW